MDGKPPQSPTWTVYIGPGTRLAVLPPLLGALRPEPSWEVHRLADVDELFGALPERGRAVLDSDELSQDDVGFVRRFVERNPGWELVLTGTDATARSGRRLLANPRVRWMDWPLDVDQLRSFWDPRATGAARSTGPSTAPRQERTGRPPQPPPAPPAPTAPEEFAPRSVAPAARTKETAEMSEIRSILEGPPEPPERSSSPPLAPHVSAPLTAPGPRALTEAAPAGTLPTFYREQIADLADIAQRLQLSTRALQESVDPEADGALRTKLLGVDVDVSRLLQFTRTLSFLAAPPGTGDQNIDVGSLLEELLGSLAGSTPDAPRYLFRSAPGLTVRSDKMLLVQAFDAMLQLATRCAGADDVVRVAALSQGGSDPAPGPAALTAAPATPRAPGAEQVEVRISFPAGPLAGLEPERILRPYSLRRALPSIGPNALAAAGGIVRGQGGHLELEELEPGQLTWIARFPIGSANGHSPLG